MTHRRKKGGQFLKLNSIIAIKNGSRGHSTEVGRNQKERITCKKIKQLNMEQHLDSDEVVE